MESTAPAVRCEQAESADPAKPEPEPSATGARRKAIAKQRKPPAVNPLGPVGDAIERGYGEAANGQRPVFTDQDAANLQRLRKKLGDEEVVKRVDRFYRDRTPAYFWRDGLVPGVAALVKSIPSLAAAAPASASEPDLSGLDPDFIAAMYPGRSNGLESK